MIGNEIKNSLNTHRKHMIGCAFVSEFHKNTNIDTHQKTQFKHAHALNKKNMIGYGLIQGPLFQETQEQKHTHDKQKTRFRHAHTHETKTPDRVCFLFKDSFGKTTWQEMYLGVQKKHTS